MKTPTNILPKLVKKVLSQRLVPMLHGSPGIGKSDIIKNIAKEANLQLIDIRLSMLSPTHLSGFGSIQGNKAKFTPFDIFPIEGDELPKGKDGWLLLFDEINSAALSTQAACYKIVLDKMVGDYKLHEDAHIVCAGNLATDGAIVNRISTALQSRLVHFEVETNVESWIDWGSSHGIDYRLLAYVNFKPQVLNSFKSDHKDKTFTCGRTLEFASKLIKESEKLTYDDLIILAGTLGEGVAKEFYGFCEIFEELPTIKEIINSPETARYNSKPAFAFGISSFIASHFNMNRVEEILIYIERMPLEFQAICLKHTFKLNPEILENKLMDEWLIKLGKFL